jgi:hypothetical protein
MSNVIKRLISLPAKGLRLAGRGIAAGGNWVAEEWDLLRSLGRTKSMLTSQLPPAPPIFSGRVAIFAHSQSLTGVGDYVLAHLAGLREAGCQTIFVTNLPGLDPKDRELVTPLCAAVLTRQNFGGSWGAWREGLRYLGDAPQIEQLILIDDSSYGPVTKLGPLLDDLDFSPVAVWGLTESWQQRWHLQNYFLVIHPNVMREAAWAKFWASLRPVRARGLIHRLGTIGFSQSLLGAGIRLKARFTQSQLCEKVDRTPLEEPEPEALRPKFRHIQLQQLDRYVATHKPFDPTQHLWRQLLLSGSPFLSRRLILWNKDIVQDLFDWNNVLEELSDYDQTNIDKDHAAANKVGLGGFDWVATAYEFARGCWRILRGIRIALGRIVGALRSHRQARFVWPDHKVECGPRVVVFVHFDKNGEVREYVLEYLRALIAAETSILFVSNSGKLSDTAIESLKPLCFGIIVRANIGYDFGAWREGLEYLSGSLDNLHWLALANDSLYGPLAPIGPILARMDFTNIDVWGFTDSEQVRWHLQSYFIAFSRRVLRSRAWHEFWRGIKPVKSKSWAIANGELRITEILQAAGFKCTALFPYQELTQHIEPAKRIANRGADPYIRLRLRHRYNLTYAVEKGYALNPTADLWRQLLRMGFPFLKRELLRLNPSGVPDSLDWQSEVAATSGADTRLIEEDLRKSVRDRVA